MTNREYLLAEMRAASARIKLCGLDLDALGLALTYNIINEDDAIKIINDRGLMCFIGQGAKLDAQDGMLGGRGDSDAPPASRGEPWPGSHS